MSGLGATDCSLLAAACHCPCLFACLLRLTVGGATAVVLFTLLLILILPLYSLSSNIHCPFTFTVLIITVPLILTVLLILIFPLYSLSPLVLSLYTLSLPY